MIMIKRIPLLIILVVYDVFPCRLFYAPVCLNAEYYALFSGKVIGILSQPCDTSFDTTRLVCNLDTLNGSEIQKRINKLQIAKTKLLRLRKPVNDSLIVTKNDSLIVTKRVRCRAYELIISHLEAFSLPEKVDTIFLSVYYGSISERSFNSSILGKRILAGGSFSKLPDKPRNAQVTVSLNGCSNFFIKDFDPVVYNFYTSTTYRFQEKHKPKVDMCFELTKDLISLNKEKSVKNRASILSNLMYHRFYLNEPQSYERAVEFNLPEGFEDIKADLIRTQHKISNDFKSKDTITNMKFKPY